MKKFFLILTSLLVFVFFFLDYKLTYGAATLQNPIGVDLTGQDGPNPAPPIGLTPCGKTMCHSNEICIKYPMEADEHCVPKDLPTPDFPPSCWDALGKGNGVFPPNSLCFNHFKNAQKNLNYYQKTCIYEPIVQYSADRYANNKPELKTQPYTLCGKGYAGPDWPGGEGSNIEGLECYVSMLVYTDVRDATLGSYGPDAQTIKEKSVDFTAQNYLYDALFQRPSNLDSSGTNEILREEYRTYWRLLPAYNQTNLRSFILNMANENLIDNIHFKYKNTLGVENETDFKKLYKSLNDQVILFWHWPFVRKGCLTDYPVCPEYSQAITELNPLLWSLSKSISENPTAISIIGPALDIYKNIGTFFGSDLSDAYSAFTPLDFNSLRGYIIKKNDEFEDQMYNLPPYNIDLLVDEQNAGRFVNSDKKAKITSVARENLPYLAAIYQGLLSPKFGLISTLQPSWVNEKITKDGESSLSDYKAGNTPEDFPEVKLAKKGLSDFLEQQKNNTPIDAITSGISWVYEKIKDLFKKEDVILKGYTEIDKDNINDEVRGQYVNFKGCPLPVSYHILSPKTAAGSPQDPTFEVYDDHHQVVTIAGNELQWNFAPKCRPLEPEKECDPNDPDYKQCIRDNRKACPNDPWNYYEEGDMCCQRHWTVTGIKHGKALTVLNNPKQTDIKNAIVQDSKYSLYKTLIPDAFNKKKITDASIDAPIALNFSSYRNGGATATSPNGDSTILNPAEPINRINNRAQDTMHLLQNCWTLPENLQNSPRCKIGLLDTATASACTGEAFRKIDPNPKPLSSKGSEIFQSTVRPQITNEVMAIYAETEKQTGVPCEVLAGIHYREADNDPNKDLQSGAMLGGKSLLDSAVQAANELLAKAGGQINDINTLIKALSWYNGGGNANCQASGSNNCSAVSGGVCGSTTACSESNTAACTCSGDTPETGSCRSICTSGFPFQFTYSGTCPPPTVGYDDPYVTENWLSPEHDNMFILYKYDCTATAPEQQNRLGTLTTAIGLFLEDHSNTPPQNGQ